MLARRLVLFLLIYLALDLSDLLLPRAFTFDLDDSTPASPYSHRGPPAPLDVAVTALPGRLT